MQKTTDNKSENKESFLKFGELTKKQASQVAPLTLAFVGDAVQALFVKTSLALAKDFKQGDLQIKCAKIVRAKAQAKLLDEVMPSLSEEDMAIVLRARNAKTNNTPKNATVEDYHKATALEAIIGYYYLCGEKDKLEQLLQKSIMQ